MSNFFLFILIIPGASLHALDLWREHKLVQSYAQHNYDQAAQWGEKLLLSKAEDCSRLVNMGKILYQQAKYAEAASYFEKVLVQDQASLTNNQKAEILFDLSCAYAQQAKLEQALDVLNQLLKIDPQNTRAQKNIEIIKKLLAEQQKKQEQKQDPQEQETKQEQASDPEQNQENQDQKESGQSQQNAKQDQGTQKNQPSNQAQNQNQDQSAQKTKQDSQSQKDNKPLTKDSQDKQKNQQAGQSQNQVQNQKQEQYQYEQKQFDSKLSEQEQKYLAAIEQSDRQAQTAFAQQQAKALEGQSHAIQNNW